jgi:predicted Fe-Mo cluster-binding NifX family protein
LKIAVACKREMVTEHFGHCEQFFIYDVRNNRIVNSKSTPNPGHKPGALPNFLHDMGVNVVISGGMGSRAVEMFCEKGIEVFTGVTGDAFSSVISYLKGSLKSRGDKHHSECEIDGGF